MRTLIFTAGLLLMPVTGCRIPEQQKGTAENKVNVRVHRVDHIEYTIPVRASGLLGTRTEMKLSFKTGGIVRSVRVREGQSVSRGEILALLDLSEIKAQVDQAEIAFEKAERDLTRAGNLYEDSVATLEQYQNARSAYELAKAQKEIADFNLSHSRITAPSEGKVLKVLIEASEMIAPGYPAILFASTESDWVVRTALTDKDIVRLSMGDTAEVTMDAFPDEVFGAVVSELGTVADPVIGTYEAELQILQPRPRFRTGFISRVSIFPAGTERSLVIPLESLLNASGSMASVYLYSEAEASREGEAIPEGEITRVRVRTGRILDSLIVVTEGLTEGQWVVTDGAKYLNRHSRVNAVNYKRP